MVGMGLGCNHTTTIVRTTTVVVVVRTTTTVGSKKSAPARAVKHSDEGKKLKKFLKKF